MLIECVIIFYLKFDQFPPIEDPFETLNIHSFIGKFLSNKCYIFLITSTDMINLHYSKYFRDYIFIIKDYRDCLIVVTGLPNITPLLDVVIIKLFRTKCLP